MNMDLDSVRWLMVSGWQALAALAAGVVVAEALRWWISRQPSDASRMAEYWMIFTALFFIVCIPLAVESLWLRAVIQSRYAWDVALGVGLLAYLCAGHYRILRRQRDLLRGGLARQEFTLVEMLAVLAIIGILFGMVATVRFSGKNAEAGVRAIDKALAMSRQYAISRKCYVALLFPDENVTGSPKAPYTRFFNRSMRPCIVNYNSGTYTFAGWARGTNWVMMPGPSQITMPAAADSASDAVVAVQWAPSLRRGDGITHYPNVTFADGSTYSEYNDVRGIVFGPAGSLHGVTTDVTIAVSVPNAPPGSDRSATVRWLGGRIRH